MRFLLRLYPPRWRERYGEEYEALLADRKVGLLGGIDIVRGALDARLHGRPRWRRPGYREEDTMILERDAMRDELRAILAARDELGPEHEHELVESFLDSLADRGLPPNRGAPIANRNHPSALSRGVRWLVVSGYALVLIVLLFAWCLALVALLTRRLTGGSRPAAYRFQ